MNKYATSSYITDQKARQEFNESRQFNKYIDPRTGQWSTDPINPMRISFIGTVLQLQEALSQVK